MKSRIRQFKRGRGLFLACSIASTGLVSAGGLLVDTTPASASVWSSMEAQYPSTSASSSGSLNSVSCDPSGTCVAVGYYYGTAGTLGLIETLSGGTWSASQAPVPVNANGADGDSLVSIACPAQGSCVAIGKYVDTSGHEQGFADVLSAGSWTSTELPAPPNAFSNPEVFVTYVACSPDLTCMAIGEYLDSNENSQWLIESLSGGTWSADEAPLPANAGTAPNASNKALDSVTCSEADNCLAVGTYELASEATEGLIDTFSAGTLSPLEAPLPANAGTNPAVSMGSVGCDPAGGCVALGSYYTGPGIPAGLVETLSSGSWNPTAAPMPSNSNLRPSPSFNSVDCPEVGECVATGSYVDTSNDHDGLIETLSGGNWSSSELPVPANYLRGANPVSVSCSSASACAVSGTYDDTSGFLTSYIADDLFGNGWSAIEAVPSNANLVPNVTLTAYSISCSASGGCASVGTYDTNASSNGIPQGYVATPVPPQPQVISFTSTSPSNATVGGPTYDVAATASSGLSVSLTVDSSAVSVCSLAGSTVSFIGTGTCVIDANQPGGNNYEPAPQAQQSFTVGLGTAIVTSNPSVGTDGAITIGQSLTDGVTVTGSPSTPPTGDVSFSACGPSDDYADCATSGYATSVDPSEALNPGTGGSSTATSQSFTPNAAGVWCFDASYNGDANYEQSSDASSDECFTVAKASQTVTFTSKRADRCKRCSGRELPADGDGHFGTRANVQPRRYERHRSVLGLGRDGRLSLFRHLCCGREPDGQLELPGCNSCVADDLRERAALDNVHERR